MTACVSNLLILPDEILLEIYKYLSNVHVLHSFYGINIRLNSCVTGYFRHIPLSDVTFNQFDYLCRSVLPEIGSHIQTLSINNCRSVLQGKIFAQYFSHQMSNIFPNLRKLTLTCFTGDELSLFLNTLNNLENLDQIEIRDVLTGHSTLFEQVVATNNHRFTSIKFRTSYSNLPLSLCLNILHLTVSVQTLDKLSYLLFIVPNIRQLNVTVEEISMMEAAFDLVSPLVYLTDFRLRCFNHFWLLEEVDALLKKLPVVECLALQLSSHDPSFVDNEQKMCDILPTSVREFHLSLRYYYDLVDEIDRIALSTARFPMVCLIDDDLEQAVIHTIPYRFSLLNISSTMTKQMSTCENYRYLEKFYDYLGMTLAQTLPIISRSRRIKEIDIQCDKKEEAPAVSVPQQQQHQLPNLSWLKRVWLLHPSREYQSLKSILQVAPNLSELFIAFDNLLPVFNDQETCQLLGQRIIHLLLLRPVPAAPTVITEEYVPNLVAIFKHLRHLQIDVTNGPPIESIVPSIINICKDQVQLISLVVEGQTSCDELKSNARQWLIDHTYLTIDGKFDADFKQQTNRFLLWM